MPDFHRFPPFPEAAATFVADTQLRANLRRATTTIRAKRNRLVGELPDFEELRAAAAAIKDDALSRLDVLLEELEANVVAAGGTVHYAHDAAEANRTIVGLVERTGASEVVKVKSMTTAETGLNAALEAAGVEVTETDLAELIVQLGDDLPSHIVVPAIHRNRSEIRALFSEHMGARGKPAPAGLGEDPAELAAAARAHLREKFLRAEVAISGANFAIAETGSLVVVESEGNGRMCLTLPRTLISLVGIEKVIPAFSDLEVFLQLLARSATGERSSPYTSVWTGVTPGDGPEAFHLVLLDNGRTSALADRVGRQALRCIRCAACLNVCPVYERVGGHAYGSVYPGPIGAVLTPQLDHVASDPVARALPFASTLCGACYEVCPVRIDIPRLLVHLRGRVVEGERSEAPSVENLALGAVGLVLSSPRAVAAFEAAGGLAAKVLRRPWLRSLPGPFRGWTTVRDAPMPAIEPFRKWWRTQHEPGPSRAVPPARHRRSVLGAPFRAEIVRALRRRLRPGGSGRGTAVEACPASSESRSAILGSSRASRWSTGPTVPVARRYRRAGGSELADVLGLFCERLGEYRANVVRTAPAEVNAAVRTVLERAGSRRVVTPVDLPPAWTSELGELEVLPDCPELRPSALDGVDASLTGCAIAIAETGTIVLDGGPHQGRRAISLVPDHLVIVVSSEQVVADVPDAVACLRPRAPQTWIAGPSATSDIELSRVEGVHGPRRLDVVLLEVPAGRVGSVGISRG